MCELKCRAKVVHEFGGSGTMITTIINQRVLLFCIASHALFHLLVCQFSTFAFLLRNIFLICTAECSNKLSAVWYTICFAIIYSSSPHAIYFALGVIFCYQDFVAYIFKFQDLLL
jgi:hypothetical protein